MGEEERGREGGRWGGRETEKGGGEDRKREGKTGMGNERGMKREAGRGRLLWKVGKGGMSDVLQESIWKRNPEFKDTFFELGMYTYLLNVEPA